MIANSAETNMMAGMIWNANTTPMLECCLPISPNTNSEPAYEKLRIFVTVAPSQLKILVPMGTRSTKIANSSCRPTPQATTRPLIARRFRDSPKPMPRIRMRPKIPVSREPSERGTGGTACAGWAFVVSCAGVWTVAPRTVLNTKRGSVKTTRAQTNVTANANTTRGGRQDVKQFLLRAHFVRGTPARPFRTPGETRFRRHSGPRAPDHRARDRAPRAPENIRRSG